MFEERQPVVVQPLVNDDGVVQWPLADAAELSRLPGVLAKLVLRRREEGLSGAGVNPTGVRRVEPANDSTEQVRELARIRPEGRGALRLRHVAARGEEGDRAAAADETGKRLVEPGLPRHVERIVQKLVQDDVGELGLLQPEQVGQQGIGKPPEGAESDARTHVGIVAIAFEVAGQGFSVSAVEVAAIRHAPDDREPPGIRFEAIATRRGDHVHDLIGIDARQRGVAATHRQTEAVSGERPYGEDELELRAGRGVEIAGQQRGDRLAAPENARLLVGSARHVTHPAARDDGQHDDRRDGPTPPEPLHRVAASAACCGAGSPCAYCSWYSR